MIPYAIDPIDIDQNEISDYNRILLSRVSVEFWNLCSRHKLSQTTFQVSNSALQCLQLFNIFQPCVGPCPIF